MNLNSLQAASWRTWSVSFSFLNTFSGSRMGAASSSPPSPSSSPPPSPAAAAAAGFAKANEGAAAPPNGAPPNGAPVEGRENENPADEGAGVAPEDAGAEGMLKLNDVFGASEDAAGATGAGAVEREPNENPVFGASFVDTAAEIGAELKLKAGSFGGSVETGAELVDSAVFDGTEKLKPPLAVLDVTAFDDDAPLSELTISFSEASEISFAYLM